MALYQILCWQEIPSQIKTWDDFDEIKIELPQKFSAKIDLSAQRQGMTQSDAYLSQWRWSDEKEREGTAQEVAEIVMKELEEEFK